MTTHEGDVPAMPTYMHPGLSKREAAALALRVPDSGTPWIDTMIRKALRAEFAKAAMQADLNYQGLEGREDLQHVAAMACEMADALLAELEKGR